MALPAATAELCLLIKAILKKFLKTWLIDSYIDFAIYQGDGGSVCQSCAVYGARKPVQLSHYLFGIFLQKWKINLRVSDITA